MPSKQKLHLSPASGFLFCDVKLLDDFWGFESKNMMKVYDARENMQGRKNLLGDLEIKIRRAPFSFCCPAVCKDCGSVVEISSCATAIHGVRSAVNGHSL